MVFRTIYLIVVIIFANAGVLATAPDQCPLDGLKKLKSLKDVSRECAEGDKECTEDKYYGRVPNDDYQPGANLNEK